MGATFLMKGLDTWGPSRYNRENPRRSEGTLSDEVIYTAEWPREGVQ